MLTYSRQSQRFRQYLANSGFGFSHHKRSIHEHHSLAAIGDDSVLQMVTQRARQHPAFDIATPADEIVWRMAMADAFDVLIDNRAFIEVAGNVVRGSADQFDAPLMRLMVGPRALEAGQERMMDIDAAAR